MCEHTELVEVTEIMVKWSWERDADGTYKPDETYFKVLNEEHLDFTCAECGALVSLDDDLRLEGAVA